MWKEWVLFIYTPKILKNFPSQRCQIANINIPFFFFRWKPIFVFQRLKMKLRLRLDLVEKASVSASGLFFFWHVFRREISLLWLLFMHCSHNIWLFNPFFAHQWVPCTVHGTHKPHFLAIFLLKMGPTILFTHLKIILLQCFLVFSCI